jgi:hypothetical protein
MFYHIYHRDSGKLLEYHVWIDGPAYWNANLIYVPEW